MCIRDSNKEFSNKKLKKSMKNTKVVNPIRVFKASKFIKTKYEEDLVKIVDNLSLIHI